MGKEKYLGEAALTETPKKKLSLKIRDGSITADKLDPSLKAAVGSMQPISEKEIDDCFLEE